MLREPRRLAQEYQRRLQQTPERAESLIWLQQQHAKEQRALARLIDAYENELLEKDEFKIRIEQARKRLRLRVLGDSRAVAQLIHGGAGVLSIEPGPGGQLSVYYTGDERFVAEVVRHLVAHGVGVVGVEPERNELERIFLEVTRGELQ